MNFAHDGGMCQKSLLITMEDSRSESLIFLGVSFCGLVSMYSVSLYDSTERSVIRMLFRVMKKKTYNHAWTEAVTLSLSEFN